VEIAATEEQHFLSYSSVASDGKYFETSSIYLESDPPVGEGVPLDILILSGQDLLAVLQAHIDRVQEYELETGTEILEIEPDKFQDNVNYGHRLASHDCYQQGLLTTAPESQLTAETLPTAIV